KDSESLRLLHRLLVLPHQVRPGRPAHRSIQRGDVESGRAAIPRGAAAPLPAGQHDVLMVVLEFSTTTQADVPRAIRPARLPPQLLPLEHLEVPAADTWQIKLPLVRFGI